jgi:hypothetical protein
MSINDWLRGEYKLEEGFVNEKDGERVLGVFPLI